MSATTLDSHSLPYEAKNLYEAKLDDVAACLATGLKANFQNVTVDVVDCPDLTRAPFHLAGKGLNGNPTLLEVGGPPYLLPLVDKSKLYDMRTMCEKAVVDKKMDEVFIIGAGAGPFPFLGTNVEVSVPLDVFVCSEFMVHFTGNFQFESKC